MVLKILSLPREVSKYEIYTQYASIYYLFLDKLYY